MINWVIWIEGSKSITHIYNFSFLKSEISFLYPRIARVFSLKIAFSHWEFLMSFFPTCLLDLVGYYPITSIVATCPIWNLLSKISKLKTQVPNTKLKYKSIIQHTSAESAKVLQSTLCHWNFIYFRKWGTYVGFNFYFPETVVE